MENTVKTELLPLLPLRGLTVFPGTIMNFDVERPISIAALNAAITADQQIFLVAQQEIGVDLPTAKDLYELGTVCTIRQVLRIPGSAMVKVMVEGVSRARIVKVHEDKPNYTAEVVRIEETPSVAETPKMEAQLRHALALYEDYTELSGMATPDGFLRVIDSNDLGHTADFIAQNAMLKHTEKQLVLEELRPLRRMMLICRILSREINVLSLEKNIDESTKDAMDRAQHDYYLREKLKTIRSELGEGEEDVPEELDEYRRKIRELHLADEVEEKLLKEVSRLAKQPFGSSESAVLRGYLDTCLEMPWNERTKDTVDIAKARKCLDEDHFGLEKVKERIIEFLAVKQLAPEMRGSVLCLVGPPGVGKTSVAISIARATNRRLARISLGGVHDEAEIRGHRKTYIGSMPGRIIAGLQQAKSMNPLMVLDEIDKLGSDHRGDPSAALLEARTPRIPFPELCSTAWKLLKSAAIPMKKSWRLPSAICCPSSAKSMV